MATSAKTPPICLGKNWIWPCKDKVFAAFLEILRRGFFSYQGGMHHPVVSRKKPDCTDSFPRAIEFRLQCFQRQCSYAHPKQASSSIPFSFTPAAKGFCSIFQISRSFVIHARCFSGAQNSITVPFRLFFKIFQCALFHFHLTNSNLLLYLFLLTVFQNRTDTISMPKCKWSKTIHVA